MEKTIGIYIRELRNEQRMSIREVAERGDMSFSYLCNLENGKQRNPSIDAIYRLSRGLRIDYFQLLRQVGWLHAHDKQKQLEKA